MAKRMIPKYDNVVENCSGNLQHYLYTILSRYVGKVVKSQDGTFLIVSVTPNGFVHYGSDKIDSFKTFMQKFNSVIV